MNTFDEAYRSADGFFGEQPEPLLVDHVEMLDPGRPVLDIGCGQGRHALYLARNGFAVDALDPSAVAIEQVARIALEQNLPVRTVRGSFQDLDPPEVRYATVLVFGLIPVLTRDEIHALADSVASVLARDGLLFVTAFGTWDPAYHRHASGWVEIGTNSFRGPKGDLRTYLEPGELPTFFAAREQVSVWEGLGPEHRHGSGPVERHGLAAAVLRF